MKRLLLLPAFFLISLCDICAQSSQHYLSRNNKLGKNFHVNPVDKEVENKTWSSSEPAQVSDYLSRNEKFHQTNQQPQTVISKPLLEHDYAFADREFRKNKEASKHQSTGAKLTKFLVFLLMAGIIAQ